MSSYKHLPVIDNTTSYQEIIDNIFSLQKGGIFYSSYDYDTVVNRLKESLINQNLTGTFLVYQAVPGSKLYQTYNTSKVFVFIENTVN